MKQLQLSPPNQILKGSLDIGGSKSISNRLLLLKEVLAPDLLLENLSESEDTCLLVKALEAIKGNKEVTLDVKHAGTDLRFLCAFLATRPGSWILKGSSRLHERPIAELVNALRKLGADIHYLEKENHPPLKIEGKILQGGSVELDAGISSQFLSALVLVAPVFQNGLEILPKGKPVSFPYVEMSLNLVKALGAEVDVQDSSINVRPIKKKPNVSKTFFVESDWSSASYWYSLCALSEDAEFSLGRFDEVSLQPDSCLPELYQGFGVKSRFENGRLYLKKEKSSIQAFEFDFTDCPDLAPTLAVTCFGLGISGRLNGLKTLQLKESRRIDALKNELQKFGARVLAGEDFLEIAPGTTGKHQPVTVSTYHDHRMAMSFAPLALVFSELRIEDPDVVAKSYPGYWKDLQSLGFRLNLQSS